MEEHPTVRTTAIEQMADREVTGIFTICSPV
jgi:hypothetical protein